MRLLVLLELGADVRIPPERDPRSGRVRENWLVRETDPDSARALDLALRLKASRPGTEVTLVHLGPPSTEPWLRQALARGGDRVVRIWDEEAAGARVAGKAVILAAAAQAVGFDLALAGAAGVINAGGQLGVLLAAHLGMPCATQVVDIADRTECLGGASSVQGQGSVEMTRGLNRGFRERVKALLPLVATVSADAAGLEAAAPPEATLAALLSAQACDITVWDLADLGVPLDRVRRADRPLRYCPPRPRHPRLHPLPSPDSELPAFDRILKLVQGVVRRREGRVVRQPAETIVDEIFRTLRDEGWLDHLSSGGGRGLGGLEAGDPP